MGWDGSAAFARVLEVCARQHGVILLSQLLDCGMSKHEVAACVRSGWLRRVRLGVYAPAGMPPSPWEDVAAVGLLAGPGSALSHMTAAAIHRIPGLALSGPPEVTVVRPSHPRLPGARVHRVPRLDPADCCELSGHLVTTPPRTLVDLCGRIGGPLLARVLDEGSIRRLWTPEEIIDSVERAGARGRKGSLALRAALAVRVNEPEVDNDFELRVVRVLAPFAPFETQYQVVLNGEVIVLDLAWPRWTVGVEADGWTVRSRSREKFDHDRHRSNLLAAHGWTIAHVTTTMSDSAILRDVGRLLPASVTGSV